SLLSFAAPALFAGGAVLCSICGAAGSDGVDAGAEDVDLRRFEGPLAALLCLSWSAPARTIRIELAGTINPTASLATAAIALPFTRAGDGTMPLSMRSIRRPALSPRAIDTPSHLAGTRFSD